ncbi:MAG TPA: response regulator [Chitinophagaceae bacterium]|nr:response regulator [Chitinophagaceae bacterium]
MNTLSDEKDILLAEDDLDDVEIFETALQEVGQPYMIRNAKNGDVLFVLLKDKIPYLLFLDIHMPCKDGMACIVEIRKNREYDKLPVIMYTSMFTEKIIEESYRNGANLYITKTNTIQDLVNKLKKVFSIDWNDYLHFPPREQFVIN